MKKLSELKPGTQFSFKGKHSKEFTLIRHEKGYTFYQSHKYELKAKSNLIVKVHTT